MHLLTPSRKGPGLSFTAQSKTGEVYKSCFPAKPVKKGFKVFQQGAKEYLLTALQDPKDGVCLELGDVRASKGEAESSTAGKRGAASTALSG